MALRGNLKDFSLPDVFQLVTFSRKTGVLRIRRRDGAEGSVWFREGDVFFAQSNWHREPLGERLAAAQKITPAALARALEIQRAEPGGRRLGHILVDEGYITEKVLEAFVQEQIQDTIFDLMRWDEGDFDFEPLADLVDEDIGLSVSIENVIMEGSRRLEEWNRIKKKVPSMDLVFKMATAPGEGTFEISLKPIEWNLLLLVDGTLSVSELASRTSRTDFEVARIIYGLFSAGLLEVAEDDEVERLREERAEREQRHAEMEHDLAAARKEREAHRAEEAAKKAAERAATAEVPEFLAGGEQRAASAEDLAVLEQMMGAVLKAPAEAPAEPAEAPTLGEAAPIAEVEPIEEALREAEPIEEAPVSEAEEDVLQVEAAAAEVPLPPTEVEAETFEAQEIEAPEEVSSLALEELAPTFEEEPALPAVEAIPETEEEVAPAAEEMLEEPVSYEAATTISTGLPEPFEPEPAEPLESAETLQPEALELVEPLESVEVSTFDDGSEFWTTTPVEQPAAVAEAEQIEELAPVEHEALSTAEEEAPAIPATEVEADLELEPTATLEPEPPLELAVEPEVTAWEEESFEQPSVRLGVSEPMSVAENTIEGLPAHELEPMTPDKVDVAEPPEPGELTEEAVAPDEEAAPAASTGDYAADLMALGLGELPPEASFDEQALVESVGVEAETTIEFVPATELSEEEIAPTETEADLTELLSSLEGDAEQPSADSEVDLEEPSAAAPGVISTDAYLADIAPEEIGFGSGIGDEITALTGGAAKSRPVASVKQIPPASEGGFTLQRDEMVDKDLVLKIIEGIKKL